MTPPRPSHSPTRAVLYAAKSVAVDEKLEVQHLRLEQGARKRHYRIADKFGETGISGTVMRGPQLKAALRMLERGEADVIMATRVDRLVRDPRLQDELRRQLLAWGCRWEFLDEEAPPLVYERKQDRLPEEFKALFRAQESWAASDRMHARLSSKHEQGWWIGPPPHGYKGDGDGGIEPDGAFAEGGQVVAVDLEERAAEYLRLVHWLIETGSVAETLDIANAVGIVQRPRRGKDGVKRARRFSRDQLASILRSRAYIGEVRCCQRCYTRDQAAELVAVDPANRWLEPSRARRVEQDVTKPWQCTVWRPGRHAALIDRATYQHVERVLSECSAETGRGRRRNTRVYPLAGHVVCAHTTLRGLPTRYTGSYTQKKLAGGGISRTRYYERIDSNNRHTGQPIQLRDGNPGVRRVNADRLDAWVVNTIAQLVENDERWQQVRDMIEGEMADALTAVVLMSREMDDRRQQLLTELAETRRSYESQLLAGLAPKGQEIFEQRLERLEDELAGREHCLADLEDLQGWYRGLTAQLDIVRAKYRRAVDYGRAGQTYRLRDVLGDILPESGGVMVYGRDDWQLTLRLGRDLERQADRFAVIEANWALQTVTAKLVYQVLNILAA